VSDNVVPLTEGCPHVDAVVSPLNSGAGGALNFRGRSPADLQRFAEDFRAGFDIAVTARFDFDKGGAATLAAASRAPIRLAHTERATPWKETGNRGFDAAYTHVLPAGPARHEVDSNLALLAALGGSDPGGGVELYPSAAERAVARALLAGGFDGAPWSARPRRLLAVAPSTASDRRNYPLPSLAALVNRLAALAGFDGVVLLGVRDDAARATALAAALSPSVLDLTGAADLRALTALLAEVDAVVAMDSGPAHMAAAVGTPVAALSCHPQGGDPLNPHAPDRFRPWGDAALVIQPPRAAAPCLDGCRAAEAHCIAGIDAASSAGEIARFFQNRRAQGDADPGQGEKPRP
jgi:heptosyltransferase III